MTSRRTRSGTNRPKLALPKWRIAIAFLLAPLAIVALPGQTPTASAAAAQPSLKPLLHGLLDRDGPPPANLESVVKSYVLSFTWKELQPSDGALATAALDRALDDARDRGARVKLRILAGVDAPAWAKRLGGSPIRLHDDHDGASGSVPRFWTPAFGAAYADLQARLADRYDADPALAEVVISRCTTFYAEPFVRQTSSAANRRTFLQAGYTPAKDKACHRAEVNAHRVWQQTRAGYAFNPAQLVKRHRQVVDDRFTVAMMRYCSKRLGDRCIVENNSIRSPIGSLDPDRRHPHYKRMYKAMTRYGHARAFQTATAEQMGKCAKTLGWAADRDASYVELPWNPADAGCTKKVLRAAARHLG
jgi:hypothetical protein